MTLSIRLLGRLQAAQEQTTVTLSNQPALLLSRLVTASKIVERADLAATLYPQSKNPRGNLAATLRLLQRQIGYEYIEATRSTLAIQPEANLWVDVWAWDRLETQLQRSWHSAESDHTQHIHLLEKMVQLYQGEFMAQSKASNSFAIDNWLTFERERYRQAFITHTEKLLQLYGVTQRQEEALQLAKRALQHEPFHEPFQINYMRLLGKQGAVSEAVQWGAKMQRRMWSELALRPSPAFAQALGDLQRKGKTKPKRQTTANMRYAAPAVSKPIFGRTEQARHVATRLINSRNRLITLFGLGGIGKTTLALTITEIVTPLLTNGICWVSFADTPPIDNPLDAQTHIARKIAQQLKMHIGANQDQLTRDVIAQLGKYDLLLVLDNFESMMAGAPLLSAILESTARVRILITSRQLPNLATNMVEAVVGLPVPDTATADNPCVRLFVQRAKTQLPTFTLNAANQAAIVDICNLVGGIPLAIELAAIWSPLFHASEIAASIHEQLNFLTNPHADADPRQQSVTAILQYSWQQLSPAEQTVLTSLTIFQDQFSRSAAEQICQAQTAQLANLIRYAFVRAHEPGWLSLHPLVRRFLTDQPLPNRHALETAYLTHFLGVLAQSGSVWNELETRRAIHRDHWERQHADLVFAWRLAIKHQAYEPLRDAVFGFSVYGAMRDMPGIVVELFDALFNALQLEPHPSLVQQQLSIRLSLYITRYGHAIQQDSAEMIRMLEDATALAAQTESADWATYAQFRTMLTLFNWGHTERGMAYGERLYHDLTTAKTNKTAIRRTALTIIRKLTSDGLSCDAYIPDWREQLHFQAQHELKDAIAVQWAQLAALELSNHLPQAIVLDYVARIVDLYEQHPHLVTGLEHRSLLNLHGQLLMQASEWQQAVATYEKLNELYDRPNALLVDPNRLIYEINYAYVLAKIGRFAHAMTLLQTNISREGGPFRFFRGVAHNSLADVYRKMGQPQQATKQLLASLAITADNFQSETVIVALFLLSQVQPHVVPHALAQQILAITVHHTNIFAAYHEEAQALYEQTDGSQHPLDETVVSKPALQQLAQRVLAHFPAHAEIVARRPNDKNGA